MLRPRITTQNITVETLRADTQKFDSYIDELRTQIAALNEQLSAATCELKEAEAIRNGLEKAENGLAAAIKSETRNGGMVSD